MDKFAEIMKQMMQMSEEERMKAINAKKGICICGNCPSYTECAMNGNELLFCAIGKSPTCITEEKGCTCPTCPVTDQMGLTNTFFCTKGSEREIRGM